MLKQLRSNWILKMTERYCQVCNTYFDGYTTTIEMSEDGKNKIFISGHDECVDTLYEKMKMVKNLDKKSVKQILKEVKFNLDT